MAPASLTTEREDRRNRRRFAYKAVVQIDGKAMPGRDISPKGLSYLLAAPRLGDVVCVSLALPSANAEGISAPARVVRIDPGPDGIVVGLEFIE